MHFFGVEIFLKVSLRSEFKIIWSPLSNALCDAGNFWIDWWSSWICDLSLLCRLTKRFSALVLSFFKLFTNWLKTWLSIPNSQSILFIRQGLAATKISSLTLIWFATKVDKRPPKDQPKRIDCSGISLIISLHHDSRSPSISGLLPCPGTVSYTHLTLPTN